MENAIAQEKLPLLETRNEPRKGGLRTMPFIILNEAFEKVASYGLMPNMVFYMIGVYHMQAATATSLLLLWSSLSNGLAIVGGFVSDSFLGRFPVIAYGSLCSLLGMTLLWLTAMIPQLQPPPCDPSTQVCRSASPGQLIFLFTSFGLISIGAGCVRPCSMAFGADQLANKDNPNSERAVQSFFNWYYAFTGLSTVLALTVIVYIQDSLGWEVGYAIPALLMVASLLTFLLGSPLYVKVEVTRSLFTEFSQVLAAAYKNRKLSLQRGNSYQYYNGNDSQPRVPTNNIRCLTKACIITDPDRDLNIDGSASDPWRLCTVEQVESLKALIRVLPMWSTGILMLVTVNQNSYSTLQANTMDRHITSSFQIPAGSLSVFMVVTLSVWIAIYDRILVPLLAKYTNQPRGLSSKVRMGIGMIISTAAMGVSGLIESIRRRIAIEEGLEEQSGAVVGMSAFWLLIPIMMLGIAEAFNAIGQIEFFYSQFPKSMSSIAVAIFTLGMAISDAVGSLLVSVVNSATSGDGKISWLASNLNQGHLNYYYWLVGFLGVTNFLYFLICCRAYGPMEEEDKTEKKNLLH